MMMMMMMVVVVMMMMVIMVMMMLHGKYPQVVKQADEDHDKTQRWLKAPGLKAETERFIIAAQDQSLPTRWYHHNILKKPDVDPKCRLFGRLGETIDHLVSGFPELAKTEYIHRQHKTTAHIHWKICKEFGIEAKERWYEHEPKAVTKKDSVTILWDMSITLTGPSQLKGRTPG